MINIVLYEPEIPQNTGNIMRTCMATNSKLHLIKPMGFTLDEKQLKRAGMDYIEKSSFTIYENWQDFIDKNKDACLIFITRYGHKPPSDHDFTKVSNIYLVFGKESTGIPKELLKKNLESCYRLPMVSSARSLNLSNCVAIVTYEVLRQLDYPFLNREESIKGKNWLEE